jgi:membrane fusion protein, cation efflux system
MKPTRLASAILAISFALSAPTVVFAHVGHGDEFQASGGIQRVKVNTENDQMMGITVTPIAQAVGGTGVMVPATALVDADGKQIVFVQYENFYEPVEVTTGATQGELVEVTQGLSAGEKLVTQGSLSLYAESRKTQTAGTAASPAAVASSPSDQNHAQAHAQGTPHSHGAVGGLPKKALAAGGGAVLVLGAIAFIATRKKTNFLAESDKSKKEGV